MGAANDHVEPRKEIGILIERTVFQDVDLDAAEHAEGGQLPVDELDLFDLCDETLRAEAAGYGETGGMIGDRDVTVPHRERGFGHQLEWRAAVRPVGVHVKIASQCAAKGKRGGLGARGPSCFEVGEVRRHRAGEGLIDHLGRYFTDVRELEERPGVSQLSYLCFPQTAHLLCCSSKSPRAVMGRAISLEQITNAMQS